MGLGNIWFWEKYGDKRRVAFPEGFSSSSLHNRMTEGDIPDMHEFITDLAGLIENEDYQTALPTETQIAMLYCNAPLISLKLRRRNRRCSPLTPLLQLWGPFLPTTGAELGRLAGRSC